ncbi:MAG: hypothetical protein IKU25_09070 [Clostridia bacterium]|nr:hypothetical protein [Clostridia bacterium]
MGNPAYNYDYFEVNEERVKQRPQIVEKRKQNRQLKSQASQGAKSSIKIMVISVLLFAMLAAVMYCRVQLDEINAQQNELKNKIVVAQSDNVRLSMELDAKASVYNIDKYAVEVLNMYKIGEQQINYLQPDFEGELLLQKSE